LRTTLIKNPEFGGKSGRLTVAQANGRLAEIVRDACLKELSVTGVGDCPEILPQAAKLCEQRRERRLMKDDDESCRVWKGAVLEAIALESAATAAAAGDGGSAAGDGGAP
jgi:hypothetical protein